VIIPEALIIVLLCLTVGMFYSYRLGIKTGQMEGIKASLDHLIEEGHLDVIDVEEPS